CSSILIELAGAWHLSSIHSRRNSITLSLIVCDPVRYCLSVRVHETSGMPKGYPWPVRPKSSQCPRSEAGRSTFISGNQQYWTDGTVAWGRSRQTVIEFTLFFEIFRVVCGTVCVTIGGAVYNIYSARSCEENFLVS